MSKAFQTFKRILDKYPLISNSVIYGSLCVGAEFSQQTITKKVLDDPPKPYDLETIGRYTIYGTTLAGPILTVCYRPFPPNNLQPLLLTTLSSIFYIIVVPFLSASAYFNRNLLVPIRRYRFLDKKLVGTTSKVVVKKLLIDQFFFTPQLLVVFYVSMSLMEGKSDIFEECRNKFVQTFKSSCMFWLPAQVVNFILIRPAFRVTYVGICSFAWVNILCWIKSQSLSEEKE